MKNKPKSKQLEAYEFLSSCSPESMYTWYVSYRTGYPINIAPMIKLIADLRGIDTSSREEFYH